jgi:hypothetical protein
MTGVVDEGADDDVDIRIIEPPTCNMDDEHTTTPVTASRKNRRNMAQKKDNSAAVCSIYCPFCIR